jgi:putative serine protease PepD
VITEVDGKLVADSDATIVAIRANHKPGDQLRLTYTRGGSSHTVLVTLVASAPSP